MHARNVAEAFETDFQEPAFVSQTVSASMAYVDGVPAEKDSSLLTIKLGSFVWWETTGNGRCSVNRFFGHGINLSH
jgi:hypothetical protein